MREKWNQIKKSNKTRKGRKSVKDKNGSEDKGKKYKIVIHIVNIYFILVMFHQNAYLFIFNIKLFILIEG